MYVCILGSKSVGLSPFMCNYECQDAAAEWRVSGLVDFKNLKVLITNEGKMEHEYMEHLHPSNLIANLGGPPWGLARQEKKSQKERVYSHVSSSKRLYLGIAVL